MSSQIILVIVFTFIIHLISTLSYSIRIVGIRTEKFAVSFALFNTVLLVSSTAGTLQAPLLAKTVDNVVNGTISTDLIFPFRLILLSSTLATIVGALMLPSFQRVFCKAVNSLDIYRSIPKLIIHGFSKSGIKQFRSCIKIPNKSTINQIKEIKTIPLRIFISNVIAVSLLTVGALSSKYAVILVPDLRTTASSLAPFITGVATILLYIFIDPYLSIMTDDVIAGKKTEAEFRKNTTFIVVGRVFGTLLAQLIFIPAAHFVAFIAEFI